MSHFGLVHAVSQRGLSLLLVAGIILSICPLSLMSQITADSPVTTSQDSLRAHAGIYMGIGMLVEGISINIHTPIPYLGAGHFVQGDWLNGLVYLGSEVGMPLIEKSLRDKVGAGDMRLFPSVSNGRFYSKTNGLSPVSQAYDKYADIAHHTEFYVRLLDFFSAYRGFHARTSLLNKVQLPNESIPSLMLSPFKPRYLTNPWVFCPILLAGIASYIDAGSDKALSSAREITMFNSTLSPVGSAFVQEGIEAYRYTLVASGEEMFFRGALLTELTERTNPTLAIGLSSLLFGVWHIPNNGVGNGLAATLAGLYLGYRYQSSGYDLGEVIATHFWLDLIVSVMEFIQNPRNGRFVYGIAWKL